MTSEFDVSHLPAEEAAAHLLVTPSALADLSLQDAARVVGYMKPKRFKAGTIVIQEGESRYNDYMLLLLSGDIAVENELPGANDSMVVTIIGPGSLLGEMGVIDGSPRSATCTANTDITVGILTRTALMRLLRDDPGVGARLLLAITKRMSDRLRETTRKLRTFAQMNRVLQQELNVVMNNRIRTERPGGKPETPT